MTRIGTRTRLGLLAAGTALVAGACAEPTGNSATAAATNAALAAALSTTPVGYGDLSSSYVGTTAAAVSQGSLWLGGGRDARLAGSALMGGGLQDAFVGGVGRGRGLASDGPFGGGLGCSSGTFDAGSGRVTCASETRNGLTVTRSAAYTTAAGAVQQAFDSLTTNTVNVRTSVTGTVAYTPSGDSTGRGGPGGQGGRGGRGGGFGACWGDGRGVGGLLLGDTATIVSATTTVQSASERTTSGLAQGSTERKVDGASSGQESTTGESSRGNFTATRVVGDTTRGLVIPVATGTATYPTAGTVIRAIRATLTYSGASPASVTRREVVTYDGSATAKITITQNDSTRTCTRALPRGELVCQ